MKKQIILVAFFTVGIALVEACSCFTTCGCGGPGDVPDYFDFKKLSVEHRQGIGLESLRLILLPDSVAYLAVEMNEQHWNGFVSAAYGCNPEPAGWAGLKFPLTKINITADQPFNDTMPSGASLNSFFQLATNIYTDQLETDIWQYQLAGLNALDTFTPFGDGPTWLVLATQETPLNASNIPFKFTVTLTKRDSTSIAVTTGEIFF